jgi:hypothetical protein
LVKSYIKLLPDFSPHPNPLPRGEGTNENISKFLLYDILRNPDNRDISF